MKVRQTLVEWRCCEGVRWYRMKTRTDSDQCRLSHGPATRAQTANDVTACVTAKVERDSRLRVEANEPEKVEERRRHFDDHLPTKNTVTTEHGSRLLHALTIVCREQCMTTASV